MRETGHPEVSTLVGKSTELHRERLHFRLRHRQVSASVLQSKKKRLRLLNSIRTINLEEL